LGQKIRGIFKAVDTALLLQDYPQRLYSSLGDIKLLLPPRKQLVGRGRTGPSRYKQKQRLGK
jgi:hypothetical protein